MKRITLITLVCIVVSSCGTLKTRDLQKTTLFLDYRPYTEEGIFLSPNAYTGQFEPVGQLELIIDPAVSRKTETPSAGYNDGIYKSSNTSIPVYYTPINAQELLDMAVSEAIKMGANGISNLKIIVEKIDYIYSEGKGLFSTVSFTPIERYIVSGFCIKIED